MNDEYTFFHVRHRTFGSIYLWIDTDMEEELREHHWRFAGPYATSFSLGSMHRHIAAAQPGEVVHHINEDKLDNRRCNLQVCADNGEHLTQPHPRWRSGKRGLYERENAFVEWLGTSVIRTLRDALRDSEIPFDEVAEIFLDEAAA